MGLIATHFVDEPSEVFEGLERRHGVDVECTETLDRRMRRVEQRELLRRDRDGCHTRAQRSVRCAIAARRFRCSPERADHLRPLTFQQRQDLARPREHLTGETGEAPNFDPIRAIRASGL
jgi:hypothetical protein